MVKAVQAGGTQVVQNLEESHLSRNGLKPWMPRVDDKRAVLVTERRAVFDRPAEVAAPVAPIEEIRDPIWDHKDGRVWTPDLVHCRLLNVGDTIARLPSPLKRNFVSLLGDMLDDAREVRRPPTAAEISIADWTWSELLKRPATQRSLLQAMAFGASVREVAKLLSRGHNIKVAKTTVGRWYLSERRALAGAWVTAHQLVDKPAFDRWRDLFEDARK